MTLEYTGPGSAFVIPYPEDWTCTRSELRGAELDSLILHKATGGIGAVRVSIWRLKDEPGTGEKFIARTRELYAKPVAGETKIMSWVQGKLGSKPGLIRVSMGAEGGTPIMVTLFVAAAAHTAMIASYTVPLNRPKTPEDKLETGAVVNMVIDTVLS